ncbi:hypothetical protein C2S52_018459 [Perilla frutescens var. hirtella]|nr:hypothetical protein C2S52_018459 [Perilla frutescens var. hirtella]KAH6812162.1 hypothetical protein C2S51_025924 [Perilla frutescens var. frutescens]
MQSDNSEVPEWLYALLSEKFFNTCIIHEDEKRNEKNIFCFDCCEGICPNCFVHHRSHRLLQIRRYMYNDVIRIREAQKLMDCAQVQFYKTNSAKVVFLNQRPPTRPCKNCSSFCVNCDKNLQESYIFCCLSCKLQHLLRTGSKLSNYLRNCDFPEPGLDDGQLTPDSVLELPGLVMSESGSSSGAAGLGDCRGLLISATNEIMRKKRSNHLAGIRSAFRPACTPVSEAVMNRRKGTPHRSPFY